MNYIGIDVSKSSFMVAYSAKKDVQEKSFSNDPGGIRKFIETLGETKGDCHCVMEATGNYSILLLYLLNEAGIIVSMENPKKIKNFARAMLSVVKTDEVDARLIALYGERMRPLPFKCPGKPLLLLKQKRTVLRQLRKQRIALGNMAESIKALPFIDPDSDKVMRKTVRFLDKQISCLEEDLINLVDSEYSRQMKLLTSVKGIGKTLACSLIIATAGFSCFSSAKQLTRYLGLSPTYEQSGTSLNRKGHINKNGDPVLRSQFYMASLSAISCNTACKELYSRLRDRGKPGKLAIIAVADKLLRQAFAVVSQDKIYVDGFVSLRPSRQDHKVDIEQSHEMAILLHP